MSNLLTKCNADVYKAILDLKQESPEIGEKLISILQQDQDWWQMPMDDVMWFSAHLPSEIWDRTVHNFFVLFSSQQITEMP